MIASPSCPEDDPVVSQEYVYNWTRDAALVSLELVAGPLPTTQPLVDYVTFAQTCQDSGEPIGWARYLIDGTKRPDWTEQTDGPALRTVALLQAFEKLDSATQTILKALIATDLAYLENVYRADTFSPWEEHSGQSFFDRSAQLRCIVTREVAA